jgi:hypothetical protein
MVEENSLAIPQTVKLSIQPQKAKQDAGSAVMYLKELLDQKKKKVIINGKRHIEFDDWIALGNVYGIDVRTHDAEPVEVFGAQGAKAKADVVRIEDGVVIGGAEAYCLGNERNWRGKPFFQLASMAQTRAGSKALSNALRWVVAVEGISGTPAEEIEDDHRDDNFQNGDGKPKPSQAKPAQVNGNKPKQQSKADDLKDNAVDADFQVKTETSDEGDETSEEAQADEPETMDMSGVNLDTLKGINKNLDKWIKTCQEKNEPKTEKQVCGWCEDLLADKKLTLEEFKQVRKALGHDVK